MNLLLLMIITFFKSLFAPSAPEPVSVPKTIYDFRVPGLSGGVIDFSKFKGKKILIVNTASKCGLTPQYTQLEALSKQYENRLIIVGFPANNFMSQEPGTNAEIGAFCQKNYGVSFPMAAKVSVKGKKQAAIYRWLTDKKYNGVKSSTVKWNFQKFLIDEQGNLQEVFAPNTKPDAPEIIAAIEK